MATSMRNLDYKPVDLAKKEIRLLEIQPGRDLNDPIVSRLVNVRITDDLEFVGICALYGDLNDIEPISINGNKINIPANIGHALRNVRTVFRRDQSSLYQQVDSISSRQTWQPVNPSLSSASSSSSSAAAAAAAARPQPPPSAKKVPGWLKHLLRGVRTLLPDESSHAARETPLRIWIECLCLNQQNTREDEQRRAHMALAYGSAKLVVGWLGPKDDMTDLAVGNLRAVDALCPPDFGEEWDREAHPENYAPQMEFLAPFGVAWMANRNEDPSLAPTETPYFKSSQDFLMRPLFHRQWILEELAMSQFPAFLIGDAIISWIQILKWNRINEEFKEGGSVHLPDEVALLANMLNIGTVHTFLEEFNNRRDKNDKRGLVKVSSSTASSSSSGPKGQLTSTAKGSRNFLQK